MCRCWVLSNTESLSARRAWIEIYYHSRGLKKAEVALRKESVDRNKSEDVSYNITIKSLSARRAWIEIVNTADQEARKRLSLSARRAWIEISLLQCQVKKYSGRSPQGERG